MSQEKNNLIRKKVFWYIVGILAIVVIAQYSKTGAVAITSGAVISTMIAKIRLMTVEYKYDQPLWFRSLLIFTGIIVIFGGMIVCRELSKLIYNATEGVITSLYTFLIILVLMITLFVICSKKRKGKDEKSSRTYIFLMVFAGCMVIAQCGGSMLHDSDLKNEQWKQEQDICLYHKEDIIGTWVETNGMDDVLGIKHSEEIFRADGSWQSGHDDAIISKGQWTLRDDVIEVHKTSISVGSTHESTDDIMTYTIIHLTKDRMECKRGEYPIVFQRKM